MSSTPSTHTNPSTPPSTPPPSQTQPGAPSYRKFFEERGVKVVDAELAEEATKMVDDPYSLFAMWRWRGAPDTISNLPDVPRQLTSIEFEAKDQTPNRPADLSGDPEFFARMVKSFRMVPHPNGKFSMVSYMHGIQESRIAAKKIKEEFGLNVYNKDDLMKVKQMAADPDSEMAQKYLPMNGEKVGGLWISPETFRWLYGNEKHESLGAWLDGPFYPKPVRDQWLRSGDLTLWQEGPARLLDPKVMYGKKLGSQLHEWYIGNVIKTMAWDKTKIGAKLIGFGAVLWFLTVVGVKRYQLEYRDHITAQLVFADRLNSLEDYYPMTEASIHQQLRFRGWLQSYYEEEEEEEDDEL